ncbi:ABC transporter ATP-binding protein [Candidatus Uabimicrobium amorphum]|uniref:ABC transporter ATP-binding protein n=1 Tax=Uabimicrobium amorphum TaxID=2596890 RepID=A0A5S9F1T6_UABAM|nr:ABC transporter ATP-binding protein [Candidatus Uabimicrobium amorphum]BBM81664.1 ABC transporter ATP-binding protein [Candidatus Uabimicrobium amorphum]
MTVNDVKTFMKSFWHMVGKKSIIVIVLSILVLVMETVGLMLLIPLLGSVILGKQQGTLTQPVFDFFAGIGIHPSLEVVLLLFATCAFFRNWGMKWQTVLGFRIAKDFSKQIFCELYNLILQTKWNTFTANHSAKYKHMLLEENYRIEVLVITGFSLLTRTLLTLAYFCFSLFLSATITLLVVLGGAALFFLLRKRLLFLDRESKKFLHHRATLMKIADEHMAFFKMIKLSHQQEKFGREISQARELVDDSRDAMLYSSAQHQFLFTFGSACLLCIFIFFGKHAVLLSPLKIMLLVVIFSRIATLLNSVQNAMKQILQFFPAFQRTWEMREWCLENRDQVYGEQQVFCRKSVDMKDIRFGYQKDVVLNDFNMKIPVYGMTAIVGESGVGKSTVIDLLLGLVVPEEGGVYIDDIPLSCGNIVNWQKQVSYVSQNCYMLEGTLRENIQHGCPQKSDEEVFAAVEKAGLGDVVRHLPLGLDSPICEKGENFSGGEKQRIAIARCFLQDSSVIIFDEATSALDYATEAQVMNSLYNMTQKTVIIVTHRLASIERADLIYCLEGGKVVEQGSYRDLLQNKNYFYRLWQKQGNN